MRVNNRTRTGNVVRNESRTLRDDVAKLIAKSRATRERTARILGRLHNATADR
jgi:hypothetical protein